MHVELFCGLCRSALLRLLNDVAAAECRSTRYLNQRRLCSDATDRGGPGLECWGRLNALAREAESCDAVEQFVGPERYQRALHPQDLEDWFVVAAPGQLKRYPPPIWNTVE